MHFGRIRRARWVVSESDRDEGPSSYDGSLAYITPSRGGLGEEGKTTTIHGQMPRM